MITLTLLHPLKDTPIQHWEFQQESVVRIGRSTDNHVVLYSAVVSRHHVELRLGEGAWDVVNLGTNGTYLEGQRIEQMPITGEVVIRLARSGPKIQIKTDFEADQSSPSPGDRKSVNQSQIPVKPVNSKIITAIDP
ncbi:FHA domain-containing protein [Roseofilum capinflatum]|uniref:FHA domain-containing protein n=1 Tax=Roseofilum capinflatum BLCC-M114 TaxID=3022440 RepID=A0ABT7B5Y9_9CYAN|nr:FHA domain-containing protein [Roseofilum capinflatum]MDJ1173946.1 FHA domain-containing protein [Roseofilum capinflatum BLCC-M114]